MMMASIICMVVIVLFRPERKAIETIEKYAIFGTSRFPLTEWNKVNCLLFRYGSVSQQVVTIDLVHTFHAFFLI